MPFAPTPAEVGLINAILNIADPQKLGLVTGEQGVKVFAGSKLPPAMLGDIWALADPENNGVLTRKGVAVTVRLIGWAQAGETPSEELIEKPGPLAVIEGVAAPAPATSAPRQPAPIATLSTPLPPLAPTDRVKFLNVYNKANPVNGLVSGDSAKNTFIRSKLPVERLNAIWNLVDTTNRGALDAAQFVLAMYFIQGSMSANPTIPVLPPSIPPFLWEQAGGRPPSVHTHTTGESLPSPRISGPGSSLAGAGIPRAFSPQYTGGSGTSHQPGSTATSQFTGISTQPTGSRIPPSIPSRPGSNFPITPQLTGQPFPLARPPQHQPAQLPWDIDAEEKAKSDGFFEPLDTARTGYIDGGAAGSFMLLSGLPEDILAKVWDLADMRNEGRFNRDTFAVAMHLINGVLEGKELPSSLPPTLVPPSMRLPASPFPNAFPAAQSAFALQQQYTGLGIPQSQTAPAMSEAHRDLLSLDDTPAEPPKPTSPPPTTLSPQVTGAGLNARFASVSNHQAASGPSAFAPAPRSFGRDLLDDEEAEGRQLKQLSDNNIGIANVRNQIASTQTAQANAERDRGDLETQVANSAATLSQLQTQLATAKVGYETETKLLEGLRERYVAQSKEIQSVRDELIRAESELSAVKLEKTEVGGSLLREKDDVRDLKKRLAEVLEETGNVKKEVDALKKEVRLQRGLLVIAKKQLSTAETELEETKKHVQETIIERDGVIADVKTAEDTTARLKEELARAASPKQNGTTSATGTPRSGTPRSGTPALPFADVSTVTSPAASFTPGARSGNPFDRLRGASVGSEASLPMRSASPFAMPSGAEVTSPTSTHTQEIRPGSAAGVASPVDDDDPFGFNEAPAIATTTSAELSKLSEDTQRKDTNLLDTATSPTTEHLISPADTSFFTPPSSSGGQNILDGLVNEQRNIELAREKATEQANENTLHHPATKFPDLTEDLTSIHNVEKAHAVAAAPSDFMENDTSNVDLDLPPLQEIPEKDESDSDSDEDEKPLGKLKEEKQAASARPSTDAKSRTITKPVESTSFDDAFGFDTPAATAPTTATTTAPSSHFSTLGSEKVLSSPASAVPGLNGHAPAASAISAFDEAFGTLPPTSEAKPTTSTEPFKFDNFEDTFDFGDTSFTHARTASNEVTAAPAHVAVPANTASAAFDDAFGPSNTFPAPSVPKPASSTAFDDAFGLPNTFTTPSVPKPASAPAPSGSAPVLTMAPLAPLSFDDAFEVSTNEQPESKPKSVASIPPGSPTSTQQTHDAPNGTSVRSPSPSAARGSSSSGRPASPPQTTSPKLPSATPRPPKETAANRPASKYESDGAGPSRSRLSIHFPFGRSKSSKEKKEKEKEKKEKEKHAKDNGHANATGGVMPPVPPIPRQYSAINEEYEGPVITGTPAEDGDLPVLKQLLEYGFEREQAIEALENSGYNFQKALNKLLKV